MANLGFSFFSYLSSGPLRTHLWVLDFWVWGVCPSLWAPGPANSDLMRKKGADYPEFPRSPRREDKSRGHCSFLLLFVVVLMFFGDLGSNVWVLMFFGDLGGLKVCGLKDLQTQMWREGDVDSTSFLKTRAGVESDRSRPELELRASGGR